MLQLFGELRELVVVGREDRLAAHAVVQMLGHRPGDRHAVVGRRATSYLVEQDEAAVGGAAQDGAGLAHLHHERGVAAPQCVARADAGEHAVHHADACSVGRHERTHLRHQHGETGLAQHGGLAGHVGAGEQDDARGGVEMDVVGDELARRQHALDHRMPGTRELERHPRVHIRAHVALAHRRLRKSRKDVERGDGAGRPAQAGQA